MIDSEIAKLVGAALALVGSMIAVARIAVGALARSFEKVLSQQAAREIANREAETLLRREILDHQARITSVMDNHLGAISVNQAKTAQSLDLVVSRLLDAALDPKWEDIRGEPR